jgi:hypothetical protein
MSTGKRPGGLTALAVVNFIFGAFGVLTSLAFIAIVKFAGELAENVEESDKAAFEAFEELGFGLFLGIVIFSFLSSILLLVSGVGYLKLKKFMGRKLGNLYAASAIIYSLGLGLVMPPDLGGGFNIGTIIGLVYPVLTLVLLNATFKDDFVN